MKPSWKIARIAGIDRRVHAPFPLLPAWVAFQQDQLRGRVAGLVLSTGCLIAREPGKAQAPKAQPEYEE